MGSLRSSCSPTPTASPTSKRWGPQPHLGADTNAPRSSQAPALHVRRSLLGDARVPGPIRATWAAAGASGIGGGWGGGGRVRARPGQGRKAARAESRRTDVAQRHRGPRCHAPFWLDPGPACPLPLSSGHLGRMKRALGACGEHEMWFWRLFADLGPGHSHSQRHSQRPAGGRSRGGVGEGGPVQAAAWVLPPGDAQLGS